MNYIFRELQTKMLKDNKVKVERARYSLINKLGGGLFNRASAKKASCFLLFMNG
ncbi:hypothetical protein [Niallia taxi]|uniref:hypothetical protein n=1 Tax=Niallia taxi TaxID=2499688 RepID=UPI002E2164E8|nr:hypothetical protein [Niallia taxi]